MKRKLSIAIALLPALLILVVILLSPSISSSYVKYSDLIDGLGSLLVGLGAFLASYKFSFPLLAYLYFSDQIEDEDTWYDFINYKIEFENKEIGIQYVFRRYANGARWWEPTCQLADALYFMMDRAHLNSELVDIKFQDYKERFQVLAHHVSINSTMGDPRYNEREIGEAQLAELRTLYNDISSEINKNKVPQWIRELLEEKYHKKSTKIIAEV